MKLAKLQKVLDKTFFAVYNNTINKFKDKEKNMASAKNYTDEMVNTMTEQYQANPTRETVDELAREFGKTTRSIIAKLSREGVYQAQPRTTKSGEPIVAKSELVSEVATILGVEVDEIASLEKATKVHLKELVARLTQLV